MYSIAYSEGVLQEAPYAEYYVERGMCHFGDLRDPDTRIVLIVPDVPDPAILRYHFRELCAMDEQQEQAARERLTILTPQSAVGCSLSERVLHDPELTARLRDEVSSAAAAEFIVFAAATSIEELGERIGVRPSQYPYLQAQRWGSKSGSKKVFHRAGVATPRGRLEVCWTADEIKKLALELAGDSSPATHIMIKLNDATWGDAIGNVVLDSRMLIENEELGAAVHTAILPWERVEREIPVSGAIVEEFLPGSVCSPSGQGYIDSAGEVRVTSSHEQFVVAGQFSGCAFPARRAFVSKIDEAVRAVGQELSTSGLRGTFGIDFIGFENGQLFAVEINTRKVGPSHVVAHVESAVGGRVGQDGRLVVDGASLCYAHRRLYYPELKNLDPEETISMLRSKGLLYSRAARRGALLHILSAISTCGYVEVTYLDHTPDGADAMLKEVEVLLRHSARRTRAETCVTG